MLRIPNLPDPTAADGMAEEDAVTLRTHGEKPEFGFRPRITSSWPARTASA